MSVRLLLIGLLLLCAGSFLQAQAADERGYVLFVPDNYDDSTPLPLVIALHGFGDTAENFMTGTDLNTVAAQKNMLVVYPQGWQRQWNDGSQGSHYEDDVEMLLNLLDDLGQQYAIDRERIYLPGFSNGGSMVFKAHCEAPGVFAAVASVGGSMRRAQTCADNARTSVLIMHSMGDDVVPFVGGNGKYAAPAAAVYHVEHNNCQTDDVPRFNPSRFNATQTMSYHFDDCDAGTQVLLYVFQELPHAWPGSLERAYNLPLSPVRDANWIILDFFSELTLSVDDE